MDNMQFYEYVLSLLAEAGHVITSSPIYANHSANETLYIDSTNDVTVNRFDRELLTLIDNVSLLADMRWEGIVDELSENVQIFSITVNFSERVRSQNVADIHHLLQRYWSCSHSIVFFKNQDSLVISFADKDCSHILSDWWDIEKDFYDIAGRIDIGNMSVENSEDYFGDFLYACAREYYLYPVSFEEASYGLMPIDYISKSLVSDIPVSREEIKEMIKQNLVLFEEIYGDDYVDPVYSGMEDLVKYHNLSDEIDRISFELELDSEGDEHFEVFDFEEDDDTLEEDDEFYDDYVDPAIFDDPILMVKWLERQQKERDDSYDNSREKCQKHKKQMRSEMQHREREHPEMTHQEAELLESGLIEGDHLIVESANQERLEAEHRPFSQLVFEEPNQDVVTKDTLASIKNTAILLRAEADRKRLDADNKRRTADQLRSTYNELLLSEAKRKKDRQIIHETIEAAKRKAAQLRSVAESKRFVADSKHDDAVNKRQIAEGLVEKYSELTRMEAERRNREEAERKAREEAERKAREEAERKAREEAERKAREEAERKAREEAERKAREEAERKAREEAERKAREEAERKAREEAERKAREEAERKAREEAEQKARELEKINTEYKIQVSAIQEKYGVRLEAAKEKCNLNASRLIDIDKRLARLNILQFVEKRNLRNEKEELEKQQQELTLLISQIELELRTCLEQAKEQYHEATSLI